MASSRTLRPRSAYRLRLRIQSYLHLDIPIWWGCVTTSPSYGSDCHSSFSRRRTCLLKVQLRVARRLPKRMLVLELWVGLLHSSNLRRGARDTTHTEFQAHTLHLYTTSNAMRMVSNSSGGSTSGRIPHYRGLPSNVALCHP